MATEAKKGPPVKFNEKEQRTDICKLLLKHFASYTGAILASGYSKSTIMNAKRERPSFKQKCKDVERKVQKLREEMYSKGPDAINQQELQDALKDNSDMSHRDKQNLAKQLKEIKDKQEGKSTEFTISGDIPIMILSANTKKAQKQLNKKSKKKDKNKSSKNTKKKKNKKK